MQMEMDFLFSLLRENNAIPNLLLHTESLHNTALTFTAQRILRFKFMTLLRIIRKGIKAGEFRPVEPATATACIIGAFNSYSAMICTLNTEKFPTPFPKSPAETQADFFSSIFDGLKAR
jgi:hypothetical protein